MKSHVSAYVQLVAALLSDVATKCGATEPTSRDLETIRSRVEGEGMSFLTITLPTFGSDFERCLALGYVDPTLFRAFKKSGSIPAFLRGMVGLVFDVGTGHILPDPSISAVSGVRQLAYFMKKLKLECSPERVGRAFEGYKQDELDLNDPLSSEDIDAFSRLVDVVWDDLAAADINPAVDLVPRHGPGATRERISGNQKYVFRRWHERLEPYFPIDSYAMANANAMESKEFQSLMMVQPSHEEPSRVITVPKTLKTPRIIAIEPVCMQYTQQAVSRYLTRYLESSRTTAGHINFTDQSVNRNLALMASADNGPEMATLDLTSASDRVPYELALCMFRHAPMLRGAIDACRTRSAQLPSGEILLLKKFASMGSALCFPVESMYFYTLCVGALIEARGWPVTKRSALRAGRDVYVYGDDLVVPANEAPAVIAYLQKYYCKVGSRKSFWTGNFRESCGMDAFRGEQVTPVYLRECVPDSARSSSELVSWVMTANQLYKAGLWRTCNLMRTQVERLLGNLPVVSETSSGLGWVSHLRGLSIERWGGRYQRPEIKAWVASPAKKADSLEGYPALLKCLLRLESPFISPIASDHLRQTERCGVVTLKRRWISVN